MEALEAETVDVPVWGDALVHASGRPVARVAETPLLAPDDARSLPDWATAPAPQEARPPRPLSPSAIATDDVAGPPMGPAAQAAARRGGALHALFERLPEIAPDRRRAAGEAWCRMSVPELDGAALTTIVLDILADPCFAPVFGPNALAEAPIAAVVGGIVIAGKVDRLVVGDDVLVVDFKTGRRVPADSDAVEAYHLKQMAAYVAALRQVFPGKAVSAALLYTEAPALIALPDAIMALHAPKDELSLNSAEAASILPA